MYIFHWLATTNSSRWRGAKLFNLYLIERKNKEWNYERRVNHIVAIRRTLLCLLEFLTWCFIFASNDSVRRSVSSRDNKVRRNMNCWGDFIWSGCENSCENLWWEAFSGSLINGTMRKNEKNQTQKCKSRRKFKKSWEKVAITLRWRRLSLPLAIVTIKFSICFPCVWENPIIIPITVWFIA